MTLSISQSDWKLHIPFSSQSSPSCNSAGRPTTLPNNLLVGRRICLCTRDHGSGRFQPLPTYCSICQPFRIGSGSLFCRWFARSGNILIWGVERFWDFGFLNCLNWILKNLVVRYVWGSYLSVSFYGFDDLVSERCHFVVEIWWIWWFLRILKSRVSNISKLICHWVKNLIRAMKLTKLSIIW